MALDKFSNTGLSTLASGIDASQLTATLTAGTGSRFPADTFNVVIWASSDFANPIDAADREIVRCTSRTGDVLTIVRGQEGTTGVAHNTPGKTYSVALIVSQKFRDDIEARLPNNKPILPVDIDPDLRNKLEFYEDFEVVQSQAAGSDTVASSKYAWRYMGADPAGAQGIGGIVRVDGHSAGLAFGQLGLVQGTAGTDAKPFAGNRLPDLRVRWAQKGTAASERRLGLGNQWTTSSPVVPTNGIYFRHAANGNIIAVCRSASVESTLDTLIAAADGTFHEGRINVESASLARIFIDGVDKGTITSNIPTTAGLTAGGHGVSNGIGTGFDLDYIWVRQNRT